MRKFFSIFKISFQQEFAYKINFIMWRVRNILQILLVFFLWDAVFLSPDRVIFGYDKAKILTYIFGIMIVRAFVFSARAVDVGAEVANGDISNLLIRPVNYFKYWLTRDLSSKALNLSFAALEFLVLFLILKPPFFFQTDISILLIFFVFLVFALLIFFELLFVISALPFWFPEMTWAGHFLVIIIFAEFLSGATFPLDILPLALQKVLYLLPFPYLIFFPIQVYLGKISGETLMGGFLISLFWLLILNFLMRWIWNKGLKAYQAFGR
jgi:ABC-2 type transport system permease protein